MASLHRRANSPYWYCAITLPGGKRTFRSTKYESREDADAVCRGWEEANKLAKQNRLSMSIARKGMNTILESVGRAAIDEVRASDYLREWYGRYMEGVAAKKTTYERYKGIAESFLESLGDNAAMPIETLEIRDVEYFKARQIKEGKAAKTINTMIKILRIPFNQARRQGIILTNPAEGVTTIRQPSNTRKIFSSNDLKKVFDAIDKNPSYEEWRGMVLLGLYTGMRIKDAASLTWGNIDMEAEAIRYTPQKTSNLRKDSPSVPMHPALESYLRSIPEGISTKTPIFPTLYHHTVNGDKGLSRKFANLLALAGIDRQEQTDSKKVKGKGRHFYGISFHSLRHTCISMLANSGVSKEMRMSIVGHDSDEHDKYTHISLEAKREALGRL